MWLGRGDLLLQNKICLKNLAFTEAVVMGCDGGSIPRRDEMVKLKKKAAKVRNKRVITN